MAHPLLLPLHADSLSDLDTTSCLYPFWLYEYSTPSPPRMCKNNKKSSSPNQSNKFEFGKGETKAPAGHETCRPT